MHIWWLSLNACHGSGCFRFGISALRTFWAKTASVVRGAWSSSTTGASLLLASRLPREHALKEPTGIAVLPPADCVFALSVVAVSAPLQPPVKYYFTPMGELEAFLASLLGPSEKG